MDFCCRDMLFECVACWFAIFYYLARHPHWYSCLADKTGERFFHLVTWWWGAILGFIIALSTMSTAGRYVSMFFMACGFVGKALNPQGWWIHWKGSRLCADASLGIERHSAASRVRPPLHIFSLEHNWHLIENVRQPLVLLMAVATSETCMPLCSQKKSWPPSLILPSE